MSAIISKILIFVTVLFSFIMPGKVNGAVVEVTNDVKTTDSVIEYTITNETGLVIANDSWVEKLEMKVGDTWVAVPVVDDIKEVAFYVNPNGTTADSYNAGLLAPGTYRLTIGYNVITAFDETTEVGYAAAEFDVGLI